MSKKVMLRKIEDPTTAPSTDNKVFLVQGGCWGDEHVIAVYNNEPAAIERAEKENKECKGLEAYVEPWDILS